MFDNRFPTIEKFSLYRMASAQARTHVNEVERRTGTNAIINTVGDRVVFRFGEKAMGGPFAEQLDRISKWTGGDIDNAVRLINYAKNMTRNEKDAVLAKDDKTEKDNRANDLEKVCEDAKPDVEDHLGHLDRKRRGTQKVISSPKPIGV